MSPEGCGERRRDYHGGARSPPAGAQPRAGFGAVRAGRAVLRDLVHPAGRGIGMAAMAASASSVLRDPLLRIAPQDEGDWYVELKAYPHPEEAARRPSRRTRRRLP